MKTYNKPLQNCICGRKPKLQKDSLDCASKTMYYRYVCETCGFLTFGTQKEIYSRENWNSFVGRKLELIKKNKKQ
jgi:hypothetical protein